MEVQYFGWSGLTVREGETVVGFDLFGEAVSWEALGEASSIILCATHGHPEHVGSLRALLSAPEAEPYLARTHLVSSLPVLRYVNKGGLLPPSRLHVVEAGGVAEIEEVRVEAFAWRHMTLLPPGWGAKGKYIVKVLRRPGKLLSIGLSGLRAPLRAPTLGYRVTFGSGSAVVNYSEGMHRRTARGEVAAVAGASWPDLLTFAVEPEDVDAIPELVEALAPASVVLYEAHRPWRDGFGLPVVDLEQYATALAARMPGVRFQVLTEPRQGLEIPASESRATIRD